MAKKVVTKKKTSTEVEAPTEENSLGEVSVQQVENMMQELHLQVQEYDEAKAEADRKKELVENTKKRLLAFLSQYDKSSYSSKYGMVIRNQKFSFKVPKAPEDRDALRAYLENNGEFDGLWSVNSQTLNAYCNNAYEAAKEGGDIDFHIPGVAEPTAFETISYRRGRI